MKRVMKFLAAAAILSVATPAAADPMLSGFDYGFPLPRHALVSQGVAMEMVYIDQRPRKANGRTVVLLHGKNFCAGSWDATIRALTAAGYRVIALDQVGFCKSTKPARYQYGLHTLAANTKGLLDALNVERPIVMGHSMGGMLAMRYAIQYPEALSGLVLVNPIGLEDWRALGVPNATVDALYEGERKTTAESIRAYQRSTYYAGTWRPEWDRWVTMLASMYEGEAGHITAWHQALTSDMIFNQPVIHELERITAPTLMLSGDRDTTAVGKNRASAELAARLGNYASLAPAAMARIRGGRLIRYADLGHSPHVQDPERFHRDLLAGLAGLR